MKKYLAMKKWLLICWTTLVAMVGSSCGDDPGNEIPGVKETSYGSYEWVCLDTNTKSPLGDTLRLSAIGGTFTYEIACRRAIFEDGVATGGYDYADPAMINISAPLGYDPKVVASKQDHCVSLTLTVGENLDSGRTIIDKLVMSYNDERLTLPTRQDAALFERVGDHWIYYKNEPERVLYLDHDGDTTQIETALAVHYSINGKPEDKFFWAEEDATLSYSLSDDEWIQIDGYQEIAEGVFGLNVITVPTPETHSAELTLRYEWRGERFEKKLWLTSTEVFHVTFD